MLEQKTLNEVLNYTKKTELPAPLKEGDIFVEAIVKVKKGNNHEAYAVAINDGKGNAVVKKMFGSFSRIESVLEIYPISLLSNESIPDFRKKKEIEIYLLGHGESKFLVAKLLSSKADADKEELRALVVKNVVKDQIKNNKAGINSSVFVAETNEENGTDKEDEKPVNTEEDGKDKEDKDNEPESTDTGKDESSEE